MSSCTHAVSDSTPASGSKQDARNAIQKYYLDGNEEMKGVEVDVDVDVEAAMAKCYLTGAKKGHESEEAEVVGRPMFWDDLPNWCLADGNIGRWTA